MTNEEAIEVFKNDIEICTIQQKQACDMAIKALEQTELNSSYNSVKTELDCVSREAVQDLIAKLLSDYLHDEDRLADTFGHPCEYEFGSESAVNVIDGDGEFCNDNCGIPAKDCWKRYFQQLMSRKKL